MVYASGLASATLALERARYAGCVINGGHVIIYSHDAEADRAFFRDVLDYPHVDAGAGWLIFKLPPVELAVHPADGPPAHELYLMCDDLDATMARLARISTQEVRRKVSGELVSDDLVVEPGDGGVGGQVGFA